MQFQEIEQKIKEQRVGEAAKKNLSRTLMLIARSMGQEIRSQGGSFDGTDGAGLEQSFCELSPLTDEEEEDFPTSDESSTIIGWVFDGLQQGCNLQIVCYAEGHHIKVSYNGNKVYEESQGELAIYVPSSDWESRIDHWAVKAGKKKKVNDEEIREKTIQNNQSLLTKLKEEIRNRWGV